jgi:hypothetical protein
MSKIDRIDADDLSEMLRFGTIKAVFGAAQLLTRAPHALLQQPCSNSTRVMLHIKALVRATASRPPARPSTASPNGGESREHTLDLR